MFFSLANNETTRVKAADLDIPPRGCTDGTRLGSARLKLVSRRLSTCRRACLLWSQNPNWCIFIFHENYLLLFLERKKATTCVNTSSII